MARPGLKVRTIGPDALVVLGLVALVGAAAAQGRALLAAGVDIFLAFPPLLAEWLPHVGPGTPAAVAIGLATVTTGPDLAQRLAWRPLLGTAWAAATAWTVSLALVDGWQRGVVERLTSDQEYLNDVPRVPDITAALGTFADHILTDQPVFWSTHVGAHPPGALLLFVWLDRIGLGDGGASGVVVMVVAGSACVAVAVALRALGHEDLARRALPFGVLLPGAVWMGVSADGLFAGVLAWGVALLAVGASRRLPAALAGGVLLGWCLYLSYGLALAVLFPLAVLLATRNVRALLLASLGAAAVVAAFTAAGFWWFTGFAHVRVIYAASIAATRPYSYFVWANLAAVAIAAGPAVVVALRRLPLLPRPALLLTGAALACIALADLSGMSKAEVERIWLPFVVWLVVPCALLPRARWWLAGQVVLALAVNHLLLTVW
ncbi:hypothetical protein ACQEVB_14015 [Pseudonocardia sp. CA-107938]|uniref:hypothetical protein n=1 Tax=Pseudonocardia sp. CA-107938 TaxID=3240021 RepID=UPI003D8C1293